MVLPILAAIVIVFVLWLIFYLFFPAIKGLLKLVIALALALLLMRGLASWFGLFSEFAHGAWVTWAIWILAAIAIVFMLLTLSGTARRVLLFLLALVGGFYLATLLARLFGIDGVTTPKTDPDPVVIQTGTVSDLYDGVQPLTPGRGCGLPRGGGIPDGAYIYAYDMRTDGVCDAQLRACDDGRLSGSYTRPACPTAGADDVVYRDDYVYENQPAPRDPLIQPDANRDGRADYRYDLQGQRIDPANPPEVEVTGIVVEEPEPIRDVNIQPIYDCQTPWGERVHNGQFIKAYRYREGHGDHHCEVQLRLCRNGELLGQFVYPECVYRVTTQG